MLPPSYTRSSVLVYNEAGECSRIPVGRMVKDWLRALRETRAEADKSKLVLGTENVKAKSETALNDPDIKAKITEKTSKNLTLFNKKHDEQCLTEPDLKTCISSSQIKSSNNYPIEFSKLILNQTQDASSLLTLSALSSDNVDNQSNKKITFNIFYS